MRSFEKQIPRENFRIYSNTFAIASRVDLDQAALLRVALSGSTLFAHGNMIKYDPTRLVDLTVNSSVLCTNAKVYL